MNRHNNACDVSWFASIIIDRATEQNTIQRIKHILLMIRLYLENEKKRTNHNHANS